MRATTIGLALCLALTGAGVSKSAAQTPAPLAMPTSPTDMFRSSTGSTPDLGSSSLDELNDFEQSLFSNRRETTRPAPASPSAPRTRPDPAAPVDGARKKTLQDWLGESPPPPAATRPPAPARPVAAPAAVPAAANPRPAERPAAAARRTRPGTQSRTARRRPPRKERAKARDGEKKAPAAVRLFAELRHLVELEFDRKQMTASGRGRAELLALDNELAMVRSRIVELKEEKRQEEERARNELLAPSEEGRDTAAQPRRDRRPPMSPSPLSSPLTRGGLR